MQVEIDLYLKSKKWQKNNIMNFKQIFIDIALYSLKTLGATNLCKTLSFEISFLSDAMIRKYNSEFRGKDNATNVLSFPSEKFLKSDLKDFIRENFIFR